MMIPVCFNEKQLEKFIAELNQLTWILESALHEFKRNKIWCEEVWPRIKHLYEEVEE